MRARRPGGSSSSTRPRGTLGMGAEVAARVMELAFDSLAAPVARVTGWDAPYPPASLEDGYLPSVDRIVDGGRRAVTY